MKLPISSDTQRRLLENLSTAVLLFDDQLRLAYINPAAEMLLAASARQTVGTHVQDLFPATPVFVAALQRALDTGHPFTERELTITLPLSQVVLVDYTVTPLAEPRRLPELLVEMLRVDHHRRAVREENLLAQHQAARALIRGLAHEIKNPLGGLRGAAQLLERELPHAPLKEYTNIIIGEADRLQNLVDRMLGPNTLPQLRRTNIHQILERVRALVLAEIPSGVHIERDYDPSIPHITADPDQLIQAVLNIVRNAVQAVGKQGEITLRTRTVRQATIGRQRHKLVIRIDITDNGPGIPPGIIEHIFYPMVSGRPGGTGLGLAIAQSLINQHRGLIECASRPGETTFTLLLPLETPDEQ